MYYDLRIVVYYNYRIKIDIPMTKYERVFYIGL